MNTTESHTKVALNVRLPEDGTVPEWVELIPAGDVVTGKDRRQWANPDPAAVVAASLSDGDDLPIDWEHSTEHKGPYGHRAPAAGWITAMEIRDGAIWARIDWTEDGETDIRKRRYRYLSPVFRYTKVGKRIVNITSVGLTNKPNLRLTALNRRDETLEEETMPLPNALCQALGLAEDATEDQAVTAVSGLKGELATAKNRAESPSLEQFVPRSDYDKALNRAETAETKVKESEATALETEIETALNSALEAGKITPGSVEYHKAQCRTEGGLERFKSYVGTAPEVGADSGLDGKPPESSGSLTGEEKAICRQLGMDESDYLETRKAVL